MELSETTQSAVNQFLLETIQSVSAAKEFVAEQAPDVVRELLIWTQISNLLWMTGTLVVAFLLVKFAIPLVKKVANSKDYDRDLHSSLLGIVFGAIGILDAFIFFICVSQMLKVTLTPKVFLLEYIKHF